MKNPTQFDLMRKLITINQNSRRRLTRLVRHAIALKLQEPQGAK